MVKAAYSSGRPALGVGAGNTPVVIDSTANIKMAVSSVIMSKTFDNGMICASEQAVIVEDAVYEKVKAYSRRNGIDPVAESAQRLQRHIDSLFIWSSSNNGNAGNHDQGASSN